MSTTIEDVAAATPTTLNSDEQYESSDSNAKDA